MMSLERFLRECEALIRGKEPFLGYWHAHGFGLFRTGTIFEASFVLHCQRHNGEKYTLRAQNAYYRDSYLRDLRRDGERLLNIDIVKKLRKVKSSTVKAIRKSIDRMRRDPRIAGSLQVVEFDGFSVTTDGPDELLAQLRATGGGE